MQGSIGLFFFFYLKYLYLIFVLKTKFVIAFWKCYYFMLVYAHTIDVFVTSFLVCLFVYLFKSYLTRCHLMVRKYNDIYKNAYNLSKY